MADRYMYMPIIGVAVIFIWGAVDLFIRFNFSRVTVVSVSVATMAALTISSFLQVSYWQNSEALFRRSIQVRPDSYMGHYGLANTLVKKGAEKEALYHFEQAVKLNPDRLFFRYMLAKYNAYRGDYDESLNIVQSSLKAYPESGSLLYLRGLIFASTKRYREAIESLRTSLIYMAEESSVNEFAIVEDFKKNNLFDIPADLREAGEMDGDSIARIKEELNKMPECLVIRLWLAERYAQTGNFEDGLATFFVKNERRWFREAFSRDIDWWLSRFPQGSLESMLPMQNNNRCVLKR